MISRAKNSQVQSRKQRGSVLVNTAVGLSAMIILLSIIDLGFLFYYKREYQKAADLASMAGSQVLANGCTAAADAGEDNAITNLTRYAYDTLLVEPGQWDRNSAGERFVPLSGLPACDAEANAVRTTISGSAPSIFPGNRNLSAEAIAILGAPQAQLKIRSTVATLDDGIVNALLSGLLGGSAAVTVAGWQGVVGADVSLLDFFNSLLGIDVAADIGTYENLLTTDASVSEILNAAIEAVGPSSAAGVTLSSFENQLNVVGVNPDTLAIPLGDLLVLQPGTETASLDALINVFDLIRAAAEIANDEHAIAATVPIAVPGVIGVTIRTSVIERPQPSVIGDPRRIGSDPRNGPGRIFVRTAQVRALVDVNLQAIGLIQGLNTLLGGFARTAIDQELSVALQIGGAEGWVTGHQCGPGEDKSLDAETETALANASIGKLTAPQKLAVFDSSANLPSASPLTVLQLRLVGVLVANVGLGASNFPLGSSSKSFEYLATTSSADGLPEIDVQPEPEEMYQSLSAQNVVSSVVDAVTSLQLTVTVLPGLGLLTGTVNGLLSGVTGLVGALVGSVLAPVLDPLLNGLLGALGLDLAEAELGAKLSCGSGGGVLVD